MKKISLFIALTCFVSSSVFAEAWNIAGARPLGMGGAFVAVSERALAQQWNPAGLAASEDEHFEYELIIHANAGYSATDDLISIADDANDLVDAVDRLKDNINASGTASLNDINTASDAMSIIDKLLDGNQAVYANVNAGAGLKIKNFAVSINNYTGIAARPVVDAVNLGLSGMGGSLDMPAGTPSAGNQGAADRLASAIDTTGAFAAFENIFNTSFSNAQDIANGLVAYAETSGLSSSQINSLTNEIIKNLNNSEEVLKILGSASGGDLEDNQTMITAQIAAFTEFAVGYGHSFLNDGLKVGANVKLVRGDISGAAYRIFNDEKDVEDIIDDAWDDKETTYKPSFDIGVKADLNKLLPVAVLPFNPQVGLVAKNINAPKFKKVDGGEYTLDPQIRMGVAVRIFNPWIIAADIDLTNNSTVLDGYNSRQFALGTEINLVNSPKFNLPLRAGIMKNLANSDDDLMFTAGLGLMFLHFNLELAGAISTGTETVDGDKIPKQASAGLNLSFVF